MYNDGYVDRLSYIANICQITGFMAAMDALDIADVIKKLEEQDQFISADNNRILEEVLKSQYEIKQELAEIKSILTDLKK